jgi:hypothetical protein
MIVWLLLSMVRDDCLFVDGNGERLTATPKQSSLTITINKQSSFTNNINKTNNQMVRDDCLLVDGNGES